MVLQVQLEHLLLQKILQVYEMCIRDRITNLLNLNPTQARLVLEDNNTKIIPIDKVEIGDKLQVLNGDQVPTDGIVLSGTTFINESSITGESVPKEKTVGDEVFGSRCV